MFGTSDLPSANLEQNAIGAPLHLHAGLSAENAPKPVAQCSTCVLRHICMASNLDETDVARLNSVVRNWKMVRQGQALYRAGDPFQSIYALRSGSIKTVLSHPSGRECVSGFFLPGETLGLDASRQRPIPATPLRWKTVPSA